jgi:hypothetical protein
MTVGCFQGGWTEIPFIGGAPCLVPPRLPVASFQATYTPIFLYSFFIDNDYPSFIRGTHGIPWAGSHHKNTGSNAFDTVFTFFFSPPRHCHGAFTF